MIRKFLYLGILLFIFGIVSAFMAASSIIPSQFSPNYRKLTVNSSSMNYLAFPLNQTGIVELLFNSSSPVDFYFTNATAFSEISSLSSTPSGIRSLATSLEGKGVYEVYKSSIFGAFPYISYGNLTAPDYMFNETALFNASTYYAVFAYSGNASATVQLTFMSIPLSGLKSGLETTGIFGSVAIILILAGLVMAVVSVFMKPKQSGQDETDKDAKKEYDEIEKSNRSHKIKSG
jgi:hypothetical protein